MFCLVAAVHGIALRSRVRRFESCWGRTETTSGNSWCARRDGQVHRLPSPARLRHETPLTDALRPQCAPRRSFLISPDPA
jgi:hypothetical protein